MTAWFAFFGRDFLASTLGWSAEERGHYVTLLVAQWEQDGIPDDMDRLEIISPGIGACWHLLEEKFPIGRGGRRRNRRLESERLKALERSEKARQSSSKRWHPAGQDEAPESAEKGPACDGICDRMSEGTSRDDPSMTMSYSPPPPPPPAKRVKGWKTLRKAWNAEWKDQRQWRSIDPPPEAISRLEKRGWLEEALRAIPEIKRGACKGFETPPTLRQFCGVDKAGVTFTARLLGGEFTDLSIQRSRRARA